MSNNAAGTHAFRLVVAPPVFFTRMQLDQYEQTILANSAATETEASRFFAQFPQFLLHCRGAEVRREVTLYDSNGQGIGRVDFFRRSFGSKYWDLIELKGPMDPVVVGAKGAHPKPSSVLTGAITQGEDYRDWIQADSSMRSRLLARGILVYQPHLIIVVGKTTCDVPDTVFRRVTERVVPRHAEIVTYSDLFEFAKEFYESTNLIVVPGRAGASREELSNDVLLATRFGLDQQLVPIDRFSFQLTDEQFRGFQRDQFEQEILLPACWVFGQKPTYLATSPWASWTIDSVQGRLLVRSKLSHAQRLDDDEVPEWIQVDLQICLGPVVTACGSIRQTFKATLPGWNNPSRVFPGTIVGDVEMAVDLPFTRDVFERLRKWFAPI